MTGDVEKDVPARDEAASPAEENGKDGQHFRLLIVANRLPITIKRQPDVRLPVSLHERSSRLGRVQVQSLRRRTGHCTVRPEEDDVIHLDRMDWYPCTSSDMR